MSRTIIVSSTSTEVEHPSQWSLADAEHALSLWQRARREAAGRATPVSAIIARRLLTYLDSGRLFPERLTPHILAALRYDAGNS